MKNKKRTYGCSVNATISGYESNDLESFSLDIYCDLGNEDVCKCPYAIGSIMPLSPGDKCTYNKNGSCCCAEARIDSLKRIVKCIEDEIETIDDIIKNNG